MDKKKNWFAKHKIITVVLALVVIGAIAGGGSSTKTNTSTNNENSASTDTAKTETKTATIPKIGESVRDGKFEFVIKGIECGKATVGTNEYLTKTAQGQYCLLNLSIKNIGDKAQSLFSGNQYLYNASNQKYSADDTATLYSAPQGSSTWYSEINPGNTVNGTIVFDIPKDQTPTTAELHDSSLSDGIKVNLQ